ncbi:hypothetical protein WAI453_004792 [Rhynchosporium graminicola]
MLEIARELKVCTSLWWDLEVELIVKALERPSLHSKSSTQSLKSGYTIFDSGSLKSVWSPIKPGMVLINSDGENWFPNSHPLNIRA